ncbi:hypothetical protein ACSBR2_027956 [Camellia fascicularis]
MVVSVVTENWASINGDADEFEKFEIPEIDSALLMSLLEESQADQDCDDDDERLMTVIRSLEAEIDPDVMDGHDLDMDIEWDSNLEGGRSTGQVEAQDWPTSKSDQLAFNWMEDVEMGPSSPSDDMAIWYMEEPYGVEMDGVIEVGGVGDYSHIYFGVPLEEHAYGSLWQETHASVMYD